jgi:hypothetical protein
MGLRLGLEVKSPAFKGHLSQSLDFKEHREIEKAPIMSGASSFFPVSIIPDWA